MTNCIFYAMFFALFLNVSLGSLRASQINRVFMSIYKGMLEASVLTIDDGGEPVEPYYNKTRLEQYVHDYLDKNISRYTTDYTITTKYYVKDSDKVCTSFCRKVKVSLKAKINLLFDYEKSQTFTIRDKDELWTRS